MQLSLYFVRFGPHEERRRARFFIVSNSMARLILSSFGGEFVA